MLVNRKNEAICSETVTVGFRLDDFVNLAVFLQPPELDCLMSQHRLSKFSQLLLTERDQSSTERHKSGADKLGYVSLGSEKMGAERPSPSACNKHWSLK